MYRDITITTGGRSHLGVLTSWIRVQTCGGHEFVITRLTNRRQSWETFFMTVDGHRVLAVSYNHCRVTGGYSTLDMIQTYTLRSFEKMYYRSGDKKLFPDRVWAFINDNAFDRSRLDELV